jgi:hypothetical protein
MGFKDNIIPGFIGKAMRDSGGTEFKNNEVHMDKQVPSVVDEFKSIIEKTPDLVMEYLEIKTEAKVIRVKNQEDLDRKLNEFLSSMSNIEIIKTDVVSSPSELYYIILYKNPLTRV